MGKTLIVAELSANHKNSYELAKKTIKAIASSGADAVKLQTYTADTITIDCDNKYFKIKSGTVWDGRTLYDLYEEAHTPWEWQSKLKEYAESLGLIFFSSPFDKTAVDFLESLNVSFYKIASFEITDIPLIEYVASKNKPVFISTGIATESEIEDAINACKRYDNNDITLLKCTSAYPAKISQANLLTMTDMKTRFNVKVGLSDHSIGVIVATTAVALGAEVVEKHFILNRSYGGPDAHFSMEPSEFSDMVKKIRDTEKALGRVSYELDEKVKKSRVFSRSIFAVKDIKKGEKFTEDNIRSIRPGHGLPPKYLKEIINKTASDDIPRGIPIKRNHIK